MKVAIIGARGFVGAAVRAAIGADIEVAEVTRARPHWPNAESSLHDAVAADEGAEHSLTRRLEHELVGCDVVINAAGLALPDARDQRALLAANALLPILAARAAKRAGTRRFIHISSAAVQGRRNPLDESPDVEPFSPYSRSKALGERGLIEGRHGHVPAELIIYRATSVMGVGRVATDALMKLTSLPFLPIAAGEDPALPLALVSRVGAAVRHLAVSQQAPLIALHPWEGMTTRRLCQAFGKSPKFVPIPRRLARAGISAAIGLGGIMPQVSGVARRAEIFVLGQRIRATALRESGFEVPIDPGGYSELADALRSGGR